MNAIKIVRQEDGVNFIKLNTKQNNPEKPQGSFGIEEEAITVTNGYVDNKVKKHWFRGEVANLEKMLNMYNYSTMPGKIFDTELLESDLDSRPEYKRQVVSKELINKPLAEFTPAELTALEEKLQYQVKRPGKNGPEMRKAGERILRFRDWDPTGTKVDTLIQHDNIMEVTAFSNAQRAQQAPKPANLPK